MIYTLYVSQISFFSYDFPRPFKSISVDISLKRLNLFLPIHSPLHIPQIIICFLDLSLPVIHKIPRPFSTDESSFRWCFQGPNTYEFSYDVENAPTNNVQYRMEERHGNGSVIGSYGQVQPNGKIRVVSYVADKDGVK